jgi:acyl-CoA reductase-like NAD-dependent aldehyde dehydrogenase
VRLIIIPATPWIYRQAIKEGLVEIFLQAGGVVSTPTCGPCLGGYMGILARGERAIATTNRNFVGRMGHPKSEVYLSNPAVAAARRAFPAWSATPDAERSRLVHAIADALGAHSEELTKLLTLEQGKPGVGFAGMGGAFEIGGTLMWAHATADLELPVEVIQDNDQARIEVHRKPLGVIGSITPWNFPLMIAIWHVMPALRSGNTVVIKPSEFTPLTTLRAVEIMNEILPPGVINIVTGDGSLGAAMSSHPDINKSVFTGSTATGKKIMQSAAGNLKRITLELGGNDAAIVLPDTDVAAAAPKIFATALFNNGQTCAALKRLTGETAAWGRTLLYWLAAMKVLQAGRN